MTEDRDLLPWILGGLSVAVFALALAVGLTGRIMPTHASSPAFVPVPALATAELSRRPSTHIPPSIDALASSMSSSAPTSAFAAPPAQSTRDAPPAAAAGTRIWECTTNGIKTFSNSRCGSTAVVREVGPINVMDSSPSVSNVHWYAPDSNRAPDDYNPSPPPPVDDSYPLVVGAPYLVRRRPEHHHHPNNHDRGHPRRD
jgi:hypothetical protein